MELGHIRAVNAGRETQFRGILASFALGARLGLWVAELVQGTHRAVGAAGSCVLAGKAGVARGHTRDVAVVLASRTVSARAGNHAGELARRTD